MESEHPVEPDAPEPDAGPTPPRAPKAPQPWRKGPKSHIGGDDARGRGGKGGRGAGAAIHRAPPGSSRPKGR